MRKPSPEGLRPQARIGAQPPERRLLARRLKVPEAPDEGRVCGGLPFVGCDGSFALISRLRAAASPEGEAKKS